MPQDQLAASASQSAITASCSTGSLAASRMGGPSGRLFAQPSRLDRRNSAPRRSSPAAVLALAQLASMADRLPQGTIG